jgi:hypothetical protein
MYAGVDAVGVDRAPRREVAPGYAIFFMIWIMVGAFFVLNLFVGIVIDNFNRISAQGDSVSALMSKEQQDWVTTQLETLKMGALRRNLPPKSEGRLKVFKLVESNKFDIFIMCFILLNTFWMTMQSYDQSATMTMVQEVGGWLFNVVFFCEMVLKNIGLGPKQYFVGPDRAWNCFDSFLVWVSIAEEIISRTAGDIGINPMIFRILRVFRVARMLRLIKGFATLKAILVTLIKSVPSLGNVGLLLFLLLFIYSVLGVQCFYQVAEGDFVNRHANFKTFGIAFLTLFRCSTGESWNGLMHDCGATEDNPTFYGRCSNADGNCGNPEMSAFFFLSFAFAAAFIALNLVIGVILENFSNNTEDTQRLVGQEAIDQFVMEWAVLDPEGLHTIPSYQLVELLQKLDRPLGFKGGRTRNRAEVLSFIGDLEIPDHQGVIQFHETLYGLANRVCGVPLPECTTTEKLTAQLTSMKQRKKLPPPECTARESYLILQVQAQWKAYQAGKKARAKMGKEKESETEEGKKKEKERRKTASAEKKTKRGSKTKIKESQVAPAPLTPVSTPIGGGSSAPSSPPKPELTSSPSDSGAKPVRLPPLAGEAANTPNQS